MKASEFMWEDEELYDAMVWGRGKATARGGSVKMKFRCPSGPRKSRQVSHPAKCWDHPNVAQAQRMKTTRAKTSVQQARRQSRTKTINTASKLVRRLNKFK
jgi:hypothetical protein|tara:strand:- start:83 stop:385 length:303 start_codon:yes stop_codon:yes gene_type:complete